VALGGARSRSSLVRDRRYPTTASSRPDLHAEARRATDGPRRLVNGAAPRCAAGPASPPHIGGARRCGRYLQLPRNTCVYKAAPKRWSAWSVSILRRRGGGRSSVSNRSSNILKPPRPRRGGCSSVPGLVWLHPYRTNSSLGQSFERNTDRYRSQFAADQQRATVRMDCAVYCGCGGGSSGGGGGGSGVPPIGSAPPLF
jgi:hypothetical protein